MLLSDHKPCNHVVFVHSNNKTLTFTRTRALLPFYNSIHTIIRFTSKHIVPGRKWNGWWQWTFTCNLYSLFERLKKKKERNKVISIIRQIEKATLAFAQSSRASRLVPNISCQGQKLNLLMSHNAGKTLACTEMKVKLYLRVISPGKPRAGVYSKILWQKYSLHKARILIVINSVRQAGGDLVVVVLFCCNLRMF